MHEELQPKLKQIRQRLNLLLIERKPPKDKRARRHSNNSSFATLSWAETSCGECISSAKAGKSHFIVRVGSSENLYKTRKNLYQTRKAPPLDLHGYTKDDAFAKLDDCLKQWMELAMHDDPFVIQVKIICGCGAQVLRETVETWIKSNRNVCIAPKK